MADRYEDQYRRDRGYRRDDRGFMDRAGDEVRSWFGDDEADRRRQMDNRDRDRDYGRHGSEGGMQGWGDRGYGDRQFPDRSSGYGDRSYGSGDRGYSSGDRGYSDRGYGYGGDRSGFGDRSSSAYVYGDRSSGSGSSSGYGSNYGPSGNYGSGGGYGSGSGYGSSSGGYGSNYGSSGGYGSSSSGFQERGGEDRSRGTGWFTGRGPKGYQRSDERINDDVCDRLCDSAEIDATHVEVKVSNGEVTLTGSVQDRNQKRRAEDLIEQVSGVREVHNNLRVSQDAGAGSSSTSGMTGSSAGASTGATAGASGVGGASSIGASTTSASNAEQPGDVLGVAGGAPDKASSAGRR